MASRPGRLNRSVTVKSVIRTKTGASESTVKSGARCSIDPVSGRELEIASATGQSVTHKLVFRHQAPLVEAAHVIDDEDSVRYVVTNVRNLDRRWQEVYARES